MANKNKLSIYLVKAGLFDKEDIFEKPDEIDVFINLPDGSPVYYIPSDVHEPMWLRSFFLQGSSRNMWQANSPQVPSRCGGRYVRKAAPRGRETPLEKPQRCRRKP